jgi:tRNA(adenine34) deaminase
MAISELSDEGWMRKALALAVRAEEQGEVPVGAVLVLENELIGEGFNHPIELNDPTAHAEIMALRAGAQRMKNYRLTNTTLYVTLEPCAMCVGAILHARVKRLVFGAFDPRAGAIESVFQIANEPKLNHRLICEGGILAEESSEILKKFFKARR